MNTFTQTDTKTDTKTDIRKVFECFTADLRMLAFRTQAMNPKDVDNYEHDILLMAEHECIKSVHIQLRDLYGNLVKVHKYSIQESSLSTPQRPGQNNWPSLPSGKLWVIIVEEYPDKWKKLQQSGKLKIPWEQSSLSTDYTGMQNEGVRFYSSNSYGLERNTFVNL